MVHTNDLERIQRAARENQYAASGGVFDFVKSLIQRNPLEDIVFVWRVDDNFSFGQNKDHPAVV